MGLALLKDDGRLCYIIPQTILTAGDLDVLRYHLAKNTTIEKIITFNSPLFIKRGLKQKRIIPTSSLILVLAKNALSKTHEVEVINYRGVEDTIEDTLNNIVTGKNTDIRKIRQADLFENAANWTFIKQDKAFLDFDEEYKKRTDDISIYYNHTQAEHQFKSRFYFDGSFNIPTKDIQTKKIGTSDYWEIPYLKSVGFRATINGFYPKNKKVKIAQGSQGTVMLDTKYKIIWHYVNPDRFLFIEGKNVFPRFQQFCIASNKKEELLYLLSLLNSKTTSLLIERLRKSENEKDVLMGLSVIKQFIRVPKITAANQHIKDEIIKRAEEMLALEDKTLSDFVDFSGVLVQKLDDVRVAGNTLVLSHDNQEIELQIKGDTKLIASIIAEELGTKGLKLEKRKITLPELRNLQVIDFEKQSQLKSYIDNLVFALYFDIPLKGVGLENSDEIREACLESKYYKIL